MDSTSLLLRLLAEGRVVSALSFDYGQKHKIELQRLSANVNYLKQSGHRFAWTTLDLSQLGELYHSALTNESWDVPKGHYEQANMKQTVVPNRNAIFASIAYGYALSIATKNECEVDFCLGVHSGDHAIYPDCRPEFYDAIIKAFEIGNWDSDKVHLHLPYLHGDKFTILKDADQSIAELGLDFDTVFTNTCTSYSPDPSGRSHGQTGSDVERILAFHQFGRQDPIQYTQPWETVLAAALKLEQQQRTPNNRS
jgi:7-cyano-7-deazaguanine synthase